MEKIKLKHNTPEWLAFRKTGIGGSDAAAIIGESPYKTNIELWEEKIGLKKPKPVTNNRLVNYGIDAEKHLFQMFKLDYPQYIVKNPKNVVYKNYGFMFASLDGELKDRITHEIGIYEGKTAEIQSRLAKEKWRGKIPQHYYCQILHYLLVTERTFAILKAQLKWYENDDVVTETRHYKIKAADVKVDMEYLLFEEQKFWGYVQRKERPPVRLKSF